MTTQLYNEGTYSTGAYGGLGTLPDTYDDCLDAIEVAPYESVKLRLINLLPSLRGDQNPNYKKGIELISKQTNANTISALQSEIYTFVQVDEDVVGVFDYFEDGYAELNPGRISDVFSSYVGVYVSDEGEYSGEIGNSQTTPIGEPEEPTTPTEPEEPTTPTEPEEPTTPTEPEETTVSIDLTISSSTTNYNLKTALLNAGWDGTTAVICTCTINSGVTVYATSTGSYAWQTGADYPVGSELTLVNSGTILGKGGDGGAGGSTGSNGSSGFGGGPALFAGYPISITNNGRIAGGGGGAGGGGAAS